MKRQCHVFPFARLPGVLSSGLFHPGSQLWRFPNMNAFGPAEAVPCRESLGLSLGKLELLTPCLVFPAFGMAASGSR